MSDAGGALVGEEIVAGWVKAATKNSVARRPRALVGQERTKKRRRVDPNPSRNDPRQHRILTPAGNFAIWIGAGDENRTHVLSLGSWSLITSLVTVNVKAADPEERGSWNRRNTLGFLGYHTY